MDILYLISHLPEKRYQKRFDVLRSDFSQGVVYWNRAVEEQGQVTGIQQYEISIAANNGSPLKRLPETLQFLKRAKRIVENVCPRCLYAGNLDMLCVALLYKKKYSNTKIIYEVADLHSLVVDEQSGLTRLVQIVLRKIEKYLIKNVDQLVLTSMEFYGTYYKDLIDKESVLFMPNMPIMSAFEGKNVAKRGGRFTVGFIGLIRYIDQLKNLLKASEEADVDVIFAGSDISNSDIESLCTKSTYAKYLGPFNYEAQVAELYRQVDCIYCVYDADMFNVRAALPNKLYEAIYCEKPILVAKNTYLSKLVEDMGVGISVSHLDYSETVRVLEELKKKGALYDSCVNACRANKSEANPLEYNESFLKMVNGLLAQACPPQKKEVI